MAKRKPAEGITDLEGNPGSPHADPLSSSEPSLGTAPLPADAEKAVERAETKKVTKAKAEEAEKPKPVIPYRVFATISGVKPANLAGFAHHVKREEMRPATVEEWRKRLDAFMTKPVKSLRKG